MLYTNIVIERRNDNCMLTREEKEKILRNTIIVFWLLLFSCFIIKIFGGNLFEIAIESERVIKMCNFIDKYPIIHYGLNYISYLFVMTMLTKSLINFKVKKYHKYIWILIFLIINSLRFINVYLGMALDIIYLIMASYIYNHMIYKGVIGNISIVVFQIISVFTRNLGIDVVVTSSLIELILCVDYYIMIILYYLYSRVRKEGYHGILWWMAILKKRNLVVSRKREN
jgi:hypothetical protein